MTGALTEVVQYEGLRPIRQSRQDGDMLCLASTGLAQIVEVSSLHHFLLEAESTFSGRRFACGSSSADGQTVEL